MVAKSLLTATAALAFAASVAVAQSTGGGTGGGTGTEAGRQTHGQTGQTGSGSGQSGRQGQTGTAGQTGSGQTGTGQSDQIGGKAGQERHGTDSTGANWRSERPPQTAGQPGQPGQPGQQPGQLSSDINMDRDNSGFAQQLTTIRQDPSKIGDRLFVLNASMKNTCEVDLARRAMQKSQDPEIRQISQTIVTDHERANQALENAARELNVQPVREVPAFKRMEAEAMLALPEDQFKKAYLSHLKAGHAAALCKYQDQAVITQNQALKQYVNDTLPHLQHHNQMVAQAARAAGLPAFAGTDTSDLPGR